MTGSKEQVYAPGHHPSQTKHHEWRTAENSAAHLIPHLQRLGRERPHLRVLDVGAGSGTITASLAKYLPPDGTILGTDISDDILARAREHAAAQGPDVAARVAFQRASVYELPFPDGAFDVVHAHQVLCHLAAPADAAREMARVCAPGGVVALREADLRMWCAWPALDGLERFHRLMVDVMVANGGQAEGGRRLLSWVLEAGAERGDVEVSFGTWCYSAPEDRRAWGGSMINRLRTGQMRDKGIELGIVTEEGIEEMIKAWEEWIGADDATLGIMNGEVIWKKK
ncbi:S-adenosyl-L-methionine-dependent methyltransferase [Thermothelomyces heterothallicus CBS 202.75]|uniref:S-adenosyl-L-methionine-dependent methyltransferase n=1 Tax=Thermothelomyces heterothallicus CBS 202.75 TaxID=1149848 RepID=UPI003743B341